MRVPFFLLIGIALLLPLISVAQNYTSNSYQITSPTITPGGYGTSTHYELYGSMGEVAHDPSSSSHYTLQLGFFSFPFVSLPVVSAQTGNESGTVNLSWSASIPFLGYTVSGYQIGRATTSGGPYGYTAVGNVLTSNVTSLSNGTPYYFVIRTLDTNGIPIATSSELSATPSAPSITFVIDSGSQSFPGITPGAFVATSSILQVNTNNTTGFTLSVSRANTAATLLLNTNSSVSLPDKTDWIAPSATTTPGSASASTTQPQTLQFRLWKAQTDVQDYSTTWWGSDDTTANALFAGIPSTTQTIVETSIPAIATTSMRVLYDLSVPTTQQTGVYNGNIVYTLIANP